jgi:ceramide glucosyltransferase
LNLVIAHLALLLAVIGTISSTVFLILAILGAAHFHKSARHAQALVARGDRPLPPVSILKPVHGMEARLEENLETFFQQDYPDYEILFAADEADDPALAVARRLCSRYPRVRSRILVNGKPPWPNPPAYSFHWMSEVAAHEIWVTSDSDVRVSPYYLREIVPPLLEPRTGMVTCVYRGVNAGGFWSGLDALGMSVEMTAGVLIANRLEGMKFGLGPTIAVRKDALEKIGGFRTLGEYFSNDFVIGNLIEKAGYKVLLSNHIIEHVVPPMTLRKMWERQVRWAVGTRYSRPKGHFGTGLTFAIPYGILGLLAGGLTGHLYLGVGLFVAAIVNRIIESLVIGGGVVRDPRALRLAWLYPVRDMFGFLAWCASYLNAKAVWRDKNYRLEKGGKIVLRENARVDERPSAVA